MLGVVGGSKQSLAESAGWGSMLGTRTDVLGGAGFHLQQWRAVACVVFPERVCLFWWRD